jgi:hypothetical protein
MWQLETVFSPWCAPSPVRSLAARRRLDTAAGKVVVLERWQYNWLVEGRSTQRWTLAEKRQFHAEAERQIWNAWSNRAFLRVSLGRRGARSGVPEQGPFSCRNTFGIRPRRDGTGICFNGHAESVASGNASSGCAPAVCPGHRFEVEAH